MRRTLLRSPAFGRDLRRWLKSHPDTAASIEATLEQLSADAAHPSLRTHKLRGPLAGCWACSAGYDLRVVFEYTQHEGAGGHPARHHLAADDGAHGVVGRLALESRARFGQANFLGRCRNADAGLLVGDEQTAGQLFPEGDTVRVAASTPRDRQVGRPLRQVPQRPHIGVGLAGTGIEEGVQASRLPRVQYAPGQGDGQVAQFHVATGRLDAEVAIQLGVVAVEELRATPVLVAGGNVALADRELVGPAWDAVLVEADQGVVAADPIPGGGAATKGIDFVPGQVPAPGADLLPRRAGAAAGEQGEARIVHLLEMEDALQADHRGEHTGQQSALQGPVGVLEAFLGGGEPVEGLGQEQEGAGVVGGCKKKSLGGRGTAPVAGGPLAVAGTTALGTTVAVVVGRVGGSDTPWVAPSDAPRAAAEAGSASRRQARSRPYFLRKRCSAMRDTDRPQVRRMKSRRS